MMQKKGAVEFGWIFSIIVGAIILFFAFYFVGTQFMQKESMDQLVSSQALDVLYTPFSYVGSVAEASASVASLDKVSTLTIECSGITGFDDLGYNEVSTSTSYKGQVVQGIPRKAYDKYLFAEEGTEKYFFVMSKPLNMPWRIADLVYTFPNNQTYCFDASVPTSIKTELQELENISETKHFFFGTIDSGIKSKCINVCFGTTSDCDINVNSLRQSNYALGYTSKNNKKMYYYGNALLYATLFSSPELYECNLKRLASRASIQRELYIEKDKALKQKQCYSLFSLGPLSNSFNDLKTAKMTDADIGEIFSTIKANSELLNNQNRGADCALY